MKQAVVVNKELVDEYTAILRERGRGESLIEISINTLAEVGEHAQIKHTGYIVLVELDHHSHAGRVCHISADEWLRLRS